MQQIDSVESAVGISSYASSVTVHPGFAAVLKARYSDFLVHEVGLDGTVARLESLENNLGLDQESLKSTHDDDVGSIINSCEENVPDPIAKKPKLEEKTTSNPNDTAADEPNDSSVVCMNSSMEEMESKLMPLVGESAAKGAIEMLTKWENIRKSRQDDINETIISVLPPKGTDDESKYYVFPLIEDKQVRKSIHELIKSDLFKSFAVADTIDRCVRIWHILFETQMPNYGKFIRDEKYMNRPKETKMQWPENRPNYLRFVLYKENIDTATAAKDIAKLVRLSPTDKKHKGSGGGSGGLGYAGMKDKRACTTQFCTLYRKTAEEVRMVLNREDERNENARPQGGGNSKHGGSAIMRVGHFSYVDKDIRLGQLKGNRFDIVLRNVCLPESTCQNLSREQRLSTITTTLRKAADCFKQRGFINYFGMQRFGKFHDTHLVGIAILKGDYEKACEIIMRVKDGEMERTVATRKIWANRFSDVDMNDEQSVKDAEMKCAKVVARQLGRFMNCETSIVSSLSRNPRDYKRAFGSISKNMRSMFLHAYQSYVWNRAASHRIDDGGSKAVRVGDLVLTEDKGISEGGNGTSGLKGKTVKQITQEDVESGDYQITDVVLPMIGTRIDFPTDNTGSFYQKVLAEDKLTIKDFENIGDRELAVGGDYRKLICKPLDVDIEIKLYKDPLQPLFKTDLMNVHDASLDCVDIAPDTDTDTDTAVKVDSESNLVGLVIGFTLPPSAYATIALRELMRRPTSAQYQSELNLEGDCESSMIQS